MPRISVSGVVRNEVPDTCRAIKMPDALGNGVTNDEEVAATEGEEDEEG
jgi:hypothetical protein